MTKSKRLPCSSSVLWNAAVQNKWGAEMFGARTVPVEIIKEMRSKAIEIVPPYQMSKMLPQVIETPEQLLGKILHHKKD